MANLKSLTALALPGAGLTDAALSQLADLLSLESLDLTGSQIMGIGLATLDSQKGLKSLVLARSAFDDAGCRQLAKDLPRLTSLDLSDTRITDAGLESIGALTNLTSLRSIAPASRMPELRIWPASRISKTCRSPARRSIRRELPR